MQIMNRGEDQKHDNQPAGKQTQSTSIGGGEGTFIGWSVEPVGDVGWLGEIDIFSTLE